MKLRVRHLKWSTGKLIVFLEEKTAKAMNVFVGDRILLKNHREVAAVLDITKGVIGEGEIGFSKEVKTIMKTTPGEKIEARILPSRKSDDYIRKKLSGEELNEEEIKTIIEDIVQNNLTEAEVAYFISGQKLNGMTNDEVYYLTKSMIDTGETLSFGKKIISDKHCIGGVAGNRTTPLIVSICAACGLTIPKTSSKAITSAAGTADVIETLANIEINAKDLKSIIQKEGACMIWNSNVKLSPSDDKIIHIEKVLLLDIAPQLVASVLSKKISMGSKNILIDIPYGGDSKVKTIKEARKLGRLFLEVGRRFGVKLGVVLTDGKQPIGNGIGPILEMKDVLSVLRNEKGAPRDLRKKGIHLSGELLKLAGVKEGKKKAKAALKSGEAYEKFKRIVNAQNKKNDFDKRVEKLQAGEYSKTIKGWRGGKIKQIHNKKISGLCHTLGTPESKGAGVYLHKKRGRVKRGMEIITLYSDSKERLKQGLDYFWQEKVIEFS
jgi:AMP phosphorylase